MIIFFVIVLFVVLNLGKVLGICMFNCIVLEKEWFLLILRNFLNLYFDMCKLLILYVLSVCFLIIFLNVIFKIWMFFVCFMYMVVLLYGYLFLFILKVFFLI